MSTRAQRRPLDSLSVLECFVFMGMTACAACRRCSGNERHWGGGHRLTQHWTSIVCCIVTNKPKWPPLPPSP